MALNIKNPRTEKLARQVALETGETLTLAVTKALEERLERVKGRRRTPDTLRTISEISQRCSSLPGLDSQEHDETLGYESAGTFS